MLARILLVEDEKGLALTVSDRLEAEGYAVDHAADGQTGIDRALAGGYQLVILDVMLPRKSGFDVCRAIRNSGLQTPILMLTARSQVVDKVVGLQIGADDYLTKPFDMLELVARIGALLRRADRSSLSSQSDVCQFGNVQIDFRKAEALKGGVPVNLSAREFQLARYLISRKGEVISRDELLQEVWGYNALPETRTVDVHVAWLRQKLEENPQFPKFILTVRGSGYRFSA
jgi:two-component system, OmpR family, alkaline phosphatase synthesis response regulator PhoP